MINKWDRILEVLNDFKKLIPKKDRDIFLRKYAPLAFEELVKKIELSNEFDDLI